MMKMKNSNQKIILFDGVCNLCNTSVNFVIEHDKKNISSLKQNENNDQERVNERDS